MDVTLSDFKIKASPSSTAHGRVTFKVRNSADMGHEMVVIKTTRQAGNLPMRNGKTSEDLQHRPALPGRHADELHRPLDARRR